MCFDILTRSQIFQAVSIGFTICRYLDCLNRARRGNGGICTYGCGNRALGDGWAKEEGR